jgi:hypothetical protein
MLWYMYTCDKRTDEYLIAATSKHALAASEAVMTIKELQGRGGASDCNDWGCQHGIEITPCFGSAGNEQEYRPGQEHRERDRERAGGAAPTTYDL